MAGYQPLLAKSTPDYFETANQTFITAPAAGTYPIFYCERDTIIDNVSVLTSVLGTSPTFTVQSSASATGSSPTAITNAISGNATGLAVGTIVTTANFVPGPTGMSLTNGSFVVLTVAGTVTGWVGAIQIRYRTRIG